MTQKARTFSLDEIAGAFGVTREAIRLKRKAGMPCRMESGRPRFDLRDCIAWQRDQDRAEARETASPVLAVEQARKLKAEADLKELDLRARRAELIEAAVVDEMTDRIIGGFAAVAMGRLGRFEREMVKCQTAAEARRIVDRMKAALMEGARSYADEWEAEAVEIEQAAT